ncbi:hypothetical protein yrohd0001_10220 [Yersinia rohdei ATCC 43380]|nr:hypothetical protein yrohd0001_10220 [Yersinia rohdei ATCC 43380]
MDKFVRKNVCFLYSLPVSQMVNILSYINQHVTIIYFLFFCHDLFI